MKLGKEEQNIRNMIFMKKNKILGWVAQQVKHVILDKYDP